jgi:CRP/FNR family transcriptional regulator, cyclic AMP receptor protein
MNFLEASFEIIKNQNCLFYSLGDKFKVTGRSVFMMGKPSCLTLMSDITEALVKCQGASRSKDLMVEHLFSCSGFMSGCPGKVQIRYAIEKKTTAADSNALEASNSSVAQELINFSIFKTLTEPEINELASYFKTKDFRKNEIILRRGDRGEKFYIILSGSVEIIGDYGVSIATLGKGEVFGEMSLLTGSPVSAKVRAADDTRVMYMLGNYFRMMLNRFSPLQLYFSRLLAKRLSQSNFDRSKEFAVGMSGNLTEISASELLQALNMSQKTGVLTLKLPRGTARILLRDGELISAKYDYWAGKIAIFELLKEKRGEFKFKPGLPPKDMDTPAMGNFMFLMMEGMRLMDEGSDQPEPPDLIDEGGQDESDELIF